MLQAAKTSPVRFAPLTWLLAEGAFRAQLLGSLTLIALSLAALAAAFGAVAWNSGTQAGVGAWLPWAALALASGCMLSGAGWTHVSLYRRRLRCAEFEGGEAGAVLASAPDGVVTISTQGLICSMNAAAEKMFGARAADLLGQSVARIIPERLFMRDVAESVGARFVTTGQRGSFFAFPAEVTVREAEVAGQRRYVAFIRDMSETGAGEPLRQVALGLSEVTGEEFIRSLLRQLGPALGVEAAFLLEIARGGHASLLLARDGAISLRVQHEIEKTAAQAALDAGHVACLNAAREAFPHDSLLAEAGAESVIVIPLMDAAGRRLGALGVLGSQPMKDAAAAESTLRAVAGRAAAEIGRRRSEEELAAEKERLAVTLSSIGDAVLTIDVEGRIALMNHVAEQLTGWTHELAAGRPLSEVARVLDEQTHQPCAVALLRALEAGTLPHRSIMVALDRSERIVESTSAPIHDRQKRRVGTVLVFRDVTGRVRAEEELRKAEKLESLGVAAGGIAHDFNNLLTAIMGNVSLAMMTMKPQDPLLPRLMAAKRASLRAQDLAQQLLTFAKGGAPVRTIAPVGQLAREIVEFQLRGTNARVAFEAQDDLWAANVDGGQVGQALGNIATNAMEAMPNGGTIHIQCENFHLAAANPALPGLRSGKYVRIVLRDEGAGIPEDQLEKVFDPYFTTKTKGSGLGLASAYSIIRGHEGLITTASPPGRGATFSVYLPASDRPAAMNDDTDSASETSAAGGRVLIMDDEEAICTLVSCALAQFGFEVVETADAPTAIQRYKEEMEAGRVFDAVIMDLTIPGGMGGQEAVKAVLALDPGAKVIVSSGYASDPVMADFSQHGFCACLSKPYEIAALGRVVRAVAGSTKEKLVFHDFGREKRA